MNVRFVDINKTWALLQTNGATTSRKVEKRN